MSKGGGGGGGGGRYGAGRKGSGVRASKRTRVFSPHLNVLLFNFEIYYVIIY